MVLLTAQQQRDMRVVQRDLIQWIRLYPEANYTITRFRTMLIASQYPSLAAFQWSGSWIKKVRRLAGVGKRPRRTILRDHSLLSWLDMRERNQIKTLTSDVKAWWVRKEGRVPSAGTLRAFRERHYIWLNLNIRSGRSEVWNLPISRR